jgi:hypothetical protein
MMMIFVDFTVFLVAPLFALLSISSTLSASGFRTKFWRQKFQTQNTAFVQNFGTKNALSYKKREHKMLMKLTPGENRKQKRCH